MKNKAKCKLCESIIESFHQFDHVTCKCGEISVFGGSAMYAEFRDERNFLRVDDEGHEIVVKYKHKHKEENTDNDPTQPPKEITRDELIDLLETMIKNDEELPEHAKISPLNQYDLLRYMLLISNILKKG